jgi:hypothetical protein
MMERRVIMKALLGSAIIGTLLISPAAMYNIQPHSIILRKGRALARLSKQYKSDSQDQLRILITAQTDELLGYMLDRFTGHIPVDDVQLVFKKKDSSFLSDDNLPHVVDTVIPLGVMRELIHEHQLPVNVHETPNWGRFAIRYKAVLSQA